MNTKIPFSEHDNVDHPVSLYAATKKSNELMAHCYSHLYNIPTTGLRFFTVYGPWGRPDMALFLFTEAILKGEPIKLFNNGEMRRDFTYIDDIVKGITAVAFAPPKSSTNGRGKNQADPARSSAPYRLYNIGRGQPVKLMDFVEIIEEALGRKADKQFLPMQPGDVEQTHADIRDLQADFGYEPSTSIREGVTEFVEWYMKYRNTASQGNMIT
jgi:UDP-glucuronate 4-epimerase